MNLCAVYIELESDRLVTNYPGSFQLLVGFS